MTWYAHLEGRRTILAAGQVYTVGRDSDCDIYLDTSPKVSRQHLRIAIREDDSGWEITDDSAHGSATPDGLLARSSTGCDTIVLQLGDKHGPILTLCQMRILDLQALPVPQWPPRHGQGVGVDRGIPTSNKVTRFGRAANNDVVIDSLLASPHHAHVLKDGAHLWIVDLASARGTFVNGTRVRSQALAVDDIVSMGGQSFRVTPVGELEREQLSSGIPMVAEQVTVRVGRSTLTNNVTLDIPARSLVAVVGSSGSGKSTLLGALSGLRPADSGRVLVNGQDLYASYAEWRYRIGFVPQQDLVPPQLSVREALTFAARLRFPSDTSHAERASRIDEVLRDLRLLDRSDLRIDRLSGGQRKRVSVALELLTKPPILFLDEPTSGLDPGLDQQLMMLLRELADDGRTVMVVTHSMDNLGLCDKVLVLAAGGYTAYYGPPGEAPAYFGARDWPGLFLALEAKPGHEWAQRCLMRAEERTSPREIGRESRPGSAERVVVRSESGLRQLPTLISRTWRVTTSDRAYLSLLVALPLVLAALGFLVGSPAGLGTGDLSGGLNPDARILILILILGATFTGGATSIQELVKERVIYRRERSVGLSRAAYILSKTVVLGLIATVQGAVFAALTLAGRPGPQASLIFGWSTGEVIVVVGLLAFTSCMLGIALSAVLPSRETTLPALVIVTMLQVVLSGAIPLRWKGIDDVIGLAVPASWAFKALAALTNLDVLLGPSSEQDWAADTATVVTSISVLIAMGVALAVLATVLLRRSDPGRR